MGGTFRLGARTPAELDAIDGWVSSGIEFDEGSGILSIDQETVQVRLSALDLDLEATPEIVRWIRRRFWKIGPLEFESGG